MLLRVRLSVCYTLLFLAGKSDPAVRAAHQKPKAEDFNSLLSAQLLRLGSGGSGIVGGGRPPPNQALLDALDDDDDDDFGVNLSEFPPIEVDNPAEAAARQRRADRQERKRAEGPSQLQREKDKQWDKKVKDQETKRNEYNARRRQRAAAQRAVVAQALEAAEWTVTVCVCVCVCVVLLLLPILWPAGPFGPFAL